MERRLSPVFEAWDCGGAELGVLTWCLGSTGGFRKMPGSGPTDRVMR